MAEHELVTLLKKIQYDLTAIKARLSEAQRQAGALNLETKAEPALVCKFCGVKKRTEQQLADHTSNVHGIRVTTGTWMSQSVPEEEKAA